MALQRTRLLRKAGLTAFWCTMLLSLPLAGFVFGGERAPQPDRPRPRPAPKPRPKAPRDDAGSSRKDKPKPPAPKKKGGKPDEKPKPLIRPVTDKNVARAVRNGVSAVYFWAEWCGPCRIQAPIFERVSRTMAGKVKMFKMDVDETEETTQRFQITQVPSIVLFKNGRGRAKLVGLIAEKDLIAEIEEVIRTDPPPPPRKRKDP